MFMSIVSKYFAVMHLTSIYIIVMVVITFKFFLQTKSFFMNKSWNCIGDLSKNSYWFYSSSKLEYPELNCYKPLNLVENNVLAKSLN